MLRLMLIAAAMALAYPASAKTIITPTGSFEAVTFKVEGSSFTKCEVSNNSGTTTRACAMNKYWRSLNPGDGELTLHDIMVPRNILQRPLGGNVEWEFSHTRGLVQDPNNPPPCCGQFGNGYYVPEPGKILFVEKYFIPEFDFPWLDNQQSGSPDKAGGFQIRLDPFGQPLGFYHLQVWSNAGTNTCCVSLIGGENFSASNQIEYKVWRGDKLWTYTGPAGSISRVVDDAPVLASVALAAVPLPMGGLLLVGGIASALTLRRRKAKGA